MSSPRKFAGALVSILCVTVLTGFVADRLILKLAQEHQTASPQLSMAAAMGGLFAAGLIGLLAILILARSGSSTP